MVGGILLIQWGLLALLNPLDSLSLALTAVVQWRLGWSWLQYCARSGRRAVTARVLLAVYYALFGLGILAGFPQVAVPLGIKGRPAVAWLGATAHLWMYTSAAAWLIYTVLAFGRARFAPPPFNPVRRRVLNAAGGALVASPLLAVGYGALIERTSFRVREVDLPVPHLPRDLEGLRLVQLSDIHLSAFLSEQELARVIDAANQARPHVVLVTGDMISSQGDPLDACLRQLARLRADAGVLGCMGNHENYARAKEYAAREGARLGIRFLRRQTQQLRFGSATLNIAGVDYEPISRQRTYLEGAERMVAPGAVNVLLSHNPDVIPVAAAKGYDVTLSGHTHGGQVTVEILDQSLNPARFLTPFVYGLYRTGTRCAYVTRGIGTIGIPARIGAPPEIALLRLRRA